MESRLTVSALQTHLFWQDKEKNFTHLAEQLVELPSTDLVVLPEMFATGFTMEAETFAEPMGGPTVVWMQDWAKKQNTALCGSTIIRDQGKIYNRFLFVAPSGEVQYYDKRHTFTLAGEHKAYTSGQNDGIITYKDWKICLRVCYDLRFPVWGRNTMDYDLLIYTANWPHKRIHAWDTLLTARAIENMSYCIGVNRIGTDGLDLQYPGHTAIYDFLGDQLGGTTKNEPGQITIQLEKSKQQLVRIKLNFLIDRDHFLIQP